MTPEPIQTAATAQSDAAVKAGKETADKALAAGTEALTAGYEQAVATSRDQIDKLFPAATAGFDEAAGFQKQNLEALVAAGTAVSKGAEAIGQELASYNQTAFEIGAEGAKKLLGCKTIKDAFEVQSDLTRKGFDEFVAQGTKISELSVKTANEAFEPFGDRIGVVAKTATKSAA